MLLNFDTLQSIKKEIGFDDFRKIIPKLTMFRHLDEREKDRFIEQMAEFPTLKLYLLELQRHDELQNYTGVKQ